MALASFLLRPTLLPAPPPRLKSRLPTCQIKSQLHPSKDYSLSWRDELRLANGSVDFVDERLKDDTFFWDAVDRRCVDNMRMLVVDAVQNAGVGDPGMAVGMAMGMAEIWYLLYRHVMRYNPKNPKWVNRDRFVLCAGHGCLLQYVCLHLAGFESVQIEDLKRLCKLGSRTPGHPENVAGVEVTTGLLGQGVANAVGLALAEAQLSARFNKPDLNIIDHRIYCIIGDGCAMEGITIEAAALAAHWKLHKLTLIYDDNHNTIDGDTSLAFSENISSRLEALGWNTITVENVHEDMRSFRDVLLSAHKENKMPTFIRVKTQIGRLSMKEGTSDAHHGTYTVDDVIQMRKKVIWEGREPFHVIPMVYRDFSHHAEYGEGLEKEWHLTFRRYREKYPQEAEELKILLDGGLPPSWTAFQDGPWK